MAVYGPLPIKAEHHFDDVNETIIVRSLSTKLSTSSTVRLYIHIPRSPRLYYQKRLYLKDQDTMFGFGGKSLNADSDIPDLSGKVILVTGGT